jgi:hypothetical protein
MAWGGLASLLRRRVRERETRRRRGERRHASARRVGHCFGAAAGLGFGRGLRPWAAASARRVGRGGASRTSRPTSTRLGASARRPGARPSHGRADGKADGRAQAHRYAIDAKSRRPTRPKPPRRESNRWTRDREAATRQHTARDTAEKATTKTKTRAGRPLNKSALPAEPRPRRPRHLADARAEPPDLQRAARVGGRLGRVAHARPSDRRREPKRRGGTTREGRLLTGSHAR